MPERGAGAVLNDERELDFLLEQLGRQRFVNHEMRIDRLGPDVVGFVRDWGGGTADVAVLVDEARAHAWRTATGPGADVFAPRLVTWWYRSSPVWTLRAVLGLPPPGHPGEPRQLTALPPGCALPENARMDLRVRMRQRRGRPGA